MHTLSRRNLLIHGLCATAWLPLGRALAQPGPAAREKRILVLVQLSGGNDSLNTVLPLDQENWYRLRPSLSQVAAKGARLAEGLGLHPSLPGLADLWQKGRLTVLHGVGYPQPDRSHFRSMDIWHTGRVPGDPRGTREAQERQGWIGRAAERLASDGAPAALFVGPEQPPLAFFSRGVAPAAVAGADSLGASSRLPLALQEALETAPSGASTSRLQLAEANRAARQLGDLLQRAADLRETQNWPNSPLAQKLSLVARGIRAGLPTQIYGVELDGFDTHLRQAQSHARLLNLLDEALQAFDAELTESGDRHRVCVLVFSEFGRRAAENGSAGTDHGAAGAVLLLGGAKPGEHGQRPNLDQLEDGDVPMTTDLRALYAAIEQDWLGLRSESGLPALPLFS